VKRAEPFPARVILGNDQPFLPLREEGLFHEPRMTATEGCLTVAAAVVPARCGSLMWCRASARGCMIRGRLVDDVAPPHPLMVSWCRPPPPSAILAALPGGALADILDRDASCSRLRCGCS